MGYPDFDRNESPEEYKDRLMTEYNQLGRDPMFDVEENYKDAQYAKMEEQFCNDCKWREMPECINDPECKFECAEE